MFTFIEGVYDFNEDEESDPGGVNAMSRRKKEMEEERKKKERERIERDREILRKKTAHQTD